MPGARLVGFASLGVALGVVAGAIASANTSSPWRIASSVAAFLLVAVPVVAGVLALRLQAADRFGDLCIIMGCAAFFASLTLSDESLLYSVGRIAGWLIEPALVYIMLAFPSGRLTRRSERLIVGAYWFVVLVLFLPNALLLQEFPTPYPWARCGNNCPDNAFMILAREPTFLQASLRPVLEVIATLLFASAIWVMVGKIRHSTPLLRRTLIPVMAAAVLHFAAYAAYLVARRKGMDFVSLQWIAWLVLLSIPLFAASFVVSMLWMRVYSARALERLVPGLSKVANASQLRDLIAEALSDRSVELYFPQPDGAWWDSAGRRVALPVAVDERCVLQLAEGRDPVAAIAYDAALRDQHQLVAAVGAGALTVLAQQRLTAALTSSRSELEEALGRMAAAAADERHASSAISMTARSSSW
jgi:hypothetical protein